MSLKPNNAQGGTKTFDEFTPDEIAGYIKETTLIQRDRVMYRQAVDVSAISKCMTLAKRINDKGLIDSVQSTLDYIKANAPAVRG